MHENSPIKVPEIFQDRARIQKALRDSVQDAMRLHKLLGLEARPSEKATRELAEAWRPHRGAAAIFTWHCYNNPAL